LEGIRQHILQKTPYEFQKMVSYLLEAMNYFIAHVAEKGPDGGIDIIAYSDPLGTKEPRLIVQVKHRPDDSVPAEDIQKLIGTMKRASDVGIFVTSGQFSKPAKNEARTSHKHIELIDFGRFIKLWQEHYLKMSDVQKNALPLRAIYFLGSNE
jgi:restriction system protein